MRHFRLTCVLGIVVLSLLLASPVEAQPRYAVKTQGDIVQLVDARDGITVSVLTPVSNAYEMVVKGQDVIRKNFASLDALRATTGLNGIPLLWPYANRLDEQAFYANGTKYSFDTGLGNTGRGAIPIHGYLTNTKEWQLVEAKADSTAAWVTCRLDFYRNPRYMKQFPFAHVLTMTYRLADGMLEVRTQIENLSTDPMPVAIGFHPYFQLTDSTRDDWTLSIGARTHWLLNPSLIPTGETQPITTLLPDPHRVPVKDFPNLDDVFTDLERDAQGRATMTLRGKQQALDVIVGPNFKTMLVLTRTGGGRGRGAPPAATGPAGAPGAPAGTAPGTAAAPQAVSAPEPPPRGSVAIEPMAGISNSMNLAQKGLYKELQSIPPGRTWQESFWIRPRGF
jgi:aldose 1-epimerase